MKTEKIYDIIGIGIGPFNLGLAALADSVPKLNCIFFEKNTSFNWHPGMLLSNARMQVPFYADLVTLANPCNRFSYLAFLKANERLIQFAIHENNYPTRREYNNYCKWVVSQLKNLQFGMDCQTIHYNKESECFEVFVKYSATSDTYMFQSKKIVLGTGTVPFIPENASENDFPFIIHSSDYLFKKASLLEQKNITIIGSGQSAAEIFNDLLQHRNELECINWFTKSKRFYPMEYSKLSWEMVSPEYINHFYSLPAHEKKSILKQQDVLYKGINQELIKEIYDQLYLTADEENKCKVNIHANCEMKEISTSDRIHLKFEHKETWDRFGHETNALILATGYRYDQPEFLEPLKTLIEWNNEGQYHVNKNYSIDKVGNSIFVQNAVLNSHGFNSADLGMGPYRNAVILNSILGYDEFSIEKNSCFQSFGTPI